MTKFFLVLLLALLALGVFSWLASHYRWFDRKPSFLEEDPEDEEPQSDNTQCCGQHLVCEKDKRLMAQNEIVYFDDEELDAFRGTAADAYSAEALEQFSEVFYTMPADDMMDWINSLRMREIELPIELRDQALMIVSEQRTTAQ